LCLLMKGAASCSMATIITILRIIAPFLGVGSSYAICRSEGKIPFSTFYAFLINWGFTRFYWEQRIWIQIMFSLRAERVREGSFLCSIIPRPADREQNNCSTKKWLSYIFLFCTPSRNKHFSIACSEGKT
jgi:hypothetical protein